MVREIRVVLLFSFAVMFLAGCGKSPSGETGASDRNAVVMYCSVDQDYAEEVLASFREAHPEIDVRTRFDTETTKTTGLVQRLRKERDRPQADLFWSSEVFLTIRLADDGVLQPYESDVLAGWPTQYRDSQNRWYAFAGRARVIAYNPERTVDPPTAWLDLAEPKYRDRVAMADPVFGTTRGHVATWYYLWGDDRAESFLRALVANDLSVVASNSQTVREVVQGTSDFAMTDTDDVWAMQRNGHTLAVVYPMHSDTQGTLVIPNTLGFVAGREMTPAVRTLAEFILSEKTERILYESDSHNVPLVHTAIQVDEQYRIPNPLAVNYEEVAAGMNDAVDTAVRIIEGG